MSAQSEPSAEIIVNEWTWKTPAMRAMTLAVCRLALARGASEFTALDLETHGQEEHGGSWIAGSVFKHLAGAGIIAPVGALVGSEFVHLRRMNAHGNPIGVWRLANRGLAEALVARHAPAPTPPEQLELAGMAPAEVES